jgi:hypothetical protein
MITKELFKNAFYYIAPGFDFEPLCRFSNQVDSFLYVNLFLPKGQVLAKLRDHFRDNKFLELLEVMEFDNFDETRYFELHQNY